MDMSKFIPRKPKLQRTTLMGGPPTKVDPKELKKTIDTILSRKKLPLGDMTIEDLLGRDSDRPW